MNSGIIYEIAKNGELLIRNGNPAQYNYYEVCHDTADDQLDIESIQKTKKYK